MGYEEFYMEKNMFHIAEMLWTQPIWLVVSTPLKNIGQIGSFPQIGVTIKNIGNPETTTQQWILILFVWMRWHCGGMVRWAPCIPIASTTRIDEQIKLWRIHFERTIISHEGLKDPWLMYGLIAKRYPSIPLICFSGFHVRMDYITVSILDLEVSCWSFGNLLLPASSKWPFYNSNGGHLTPEKVT